MRPFLWVLMYLAHTFCVDFSGGRIKKRPVLWGNRARCNMNKNSYRFGPN
nr:MAG TPA: hypothetical protein [Caudoviricetes sp.]